MPNYRRNHVGQLFFFTLVTYERRRLFIVPRARQLLRTAIADVQKDWPWEMEAIVLLPDHLHMLWRMPDEDMDFSTRMSILKRRFTHSALQAGLEDSGVSFAQRRHRRRGFWQERFWEHTIRDARDFRMHLDYIHGNPVKHGLAGRPWDWPWSSFQRYVQKGWYEKDWCGRADLPGQTQYLWMD